MRLLSITSTLFLIFSSLGIRIAIADSAYPPPPNIRITTIALLNNEEQVFLCPTDSNIIISNWRDFRLGYRQIGIGRSTDGGLTWTDSLIRASMQYYFLDSKQSDPTLTVDRLGNFYMSVLDWDAFGFTGESIIAFYKSTDKGVSWTGPFSNLNHTPPAGLFEDKQFITVDRTGGPHDGNLYCSWTRFYNGPNRIMFVRSVGGSMLFEDTITIGPNQTSTGCTTPISAGQLSIPIVSSNGDVHIFWLGNALDSGLTCSSSIKIKHSVSSDGGQTFTYEDHVVSSSGFTLANGGINTYAQPAGDADITGGPFDGNLYISYTNFGPEDNGASDVDFIKSTDNAQTWTDRIQINDAVVSDSVDSFHPWLIVNEEGVIIVVFYDQRMVPTAYVDFDLFAAYSFDGGESFTSNHRITDVSSSPFNLRSSTAPILNWDDKITEEDYYDDQPEFSRSPRAGLIGEYIGVTAFYDKINAVWTDSRDGNSEVYTANWYLPILEPRLTFPEESSYSNSNPQFRWATSWKHNQDSYRLEVSTDPTFSIDVISQLTDTVFHDLASTLPEGVHYWRVKAFNLAGTDSSEYSETNSFEIDTTSPDPPSLLLPLDSSETNNGVMSFSWTSVSRLESPVVYDLLISTSITFPNDISTTTYSNLVLPELSFDHQLPEAGEYFWKVIAKDLAGNLSTSEIFMFEYIQFICGDIDGSDEVNIGDLTYLVSFMFKGGPTPPIIQAMDVNGDGNYNIVDLTYMVNYMFKLGPAPICSN